MFYVLCKDNKNRYTRYDSELIKTGNNKWTVKISPKKSKFKINIDFSDSSTENYRGTDYETWIYDVAHFFEQIITSDRQLTIKIYFGKCAGTIAAQCGPGDTANTSEEFDMTKIADAIDDVDIINNCIITKNASAKFSTDYYKPNKPIKDFYYTVIHEFFHAFGFGSLWNGNFRIVIKDAPSTIGIIPTNLPSIITLPWILDNRSLINMLSYIPGINSFIPNFDNFVKVLNSDKGKLLNGQTNNIGIGPTNNPQYTAQHSKEAYNNKNIPMWPAPNDNFLMTSSGGGTFMAHWNKDVFPNEIMTTTFVNDINKLYIAKFTVASLRDIGWEVDYTMLRYPLSKFNSV